MADYPESKNFQSYSETRALEFSSTDNIIETSLYHIENEMCEDWSQVFDLENTVLVWYHFSLNIYPT